MTRWCLIKARLIVSAIVNVIVIVMVNVGCVGVFVVMVVISMVIVEVDKRANVEELLVT